MPRFYLFYEYFGLSFWPFTVSDGTIPINKWHKRYNNYVNVTDPMQIICRCIRSSASVLFQFASCRYWLQSIYYYDYYYCSGHTSTWRFYNNYLQVFLMHIDCVPGTFEILSAKTTPMSRWHNRVIMYTKATSSILQK